MPKFHDLDLYKEVYRISKHISKDLERWHELHHPKMPQNGRWRHFLVGSSTPNNPTVTN